MQWMKFNARFGSKSKQVPEQSGVFVGAEGQQVGWLEGSVKQNGHFRTVAER